MGSSQIDVGGGFVFASTFKKCSVRLSRSGRCQIELKVRSLIMVGGGGRNRTASLLRSNPHNPMQINQLRSFPSEISLSEAVEKIKNYPVSSCSKFSHYSASIILLELLLEVAPGFRRNFSGSETLSPPE